MVLDREQSFLWDTTLLLLVSVLVFLLIHAAPGGPLAIYLANPNVRPADIERLRRALGLDRPLWQQYWTWLWAFVQGDWGYSFSDGRPVAARIVERMPATFELVAVSLAGALVLTMPAGVGAAVARGRWIDRVVTTASMIGVARATGEKALRRLVRAGLARTGYRRITILDRDGLLAITGEG